MYVHTKPSKNICIYTLIHIHKHINTCMHTDISICRAKNRICKFVLHIHKCSILLKHKKGIIGITPIGIVENSDHRIQ